MIKFAAILTSAALACSGTTCTNNHRCMPQELTACTPVCQSVTVQQPQPSAPAEVSAYAQEVARLVNLEREKAGLAPLQLDAQLSAAAQVRAEEIDISFSHSRPDGSSGFTVLKELGITYRAVGENIAKGSPTPERVMQGWMGSSGHKANILNENFTAIGIGVYEDAAGVMHWVQLFTA